AVLVLVIVLRSHRWYCKWLCPAGVLCDAVSNRRKSKIRLNRIPELNRMLVAASLVVALLGTPLLSILDPINIFHAFFDAFRKQPADVIMLKLSGLLLVVAINIAIPHIWCSKLCPLGGLQDILTSFKNLITKKETMNSPFLASRRLILGALVGSGLGLIARKTSGFTSKVHIRPPGALPEEQFKTACLRCGNCGKACPTDIIRSCFDPSDGMGMLTPRIEFDTGYCLPGCTVCGSVCSSGAIRKFTEPDKKKLYMGIARIKRDGCLLSENKECDLCRRYCDYDAIVIRQSNCDLSAWPEIIEDRCVGCGACMVVCPVSVIDVLPVRRVE
ncbi:MAG: 4Fe-4S binding protein, partial [Gemmatimonadota bacterium]|nr:4Fe-4S binding protein [Gemmatimonadota bacterium]